MSTAKAPSSGYHGSRATREPAARRKDRGAALKSRGFKHAHRQMLDARSWQGLIRAISTRIDPARDLTILEHTSIDYLDFASSEPGLGSTFGIDATSKWPRETQAGMRSQDRMSDDVGFVEVYNYHLASRLAKMRTPVALRDIMLQPVRTGYIG